MIPQLSSFEATINGTIGNVANVATLKNDFARLLANAGIVVTDSSIDFVNVATAAAQGYFFSQPYQGTFDCYTTIDYGVLDDIKAQFSLAAQGAAGSVPQAVWIPSYIDASTGLAASTGDPTPARLNPPSTSTAAGFIDTVTKAIDRITSDIEGFGKGTQTITLTTVVSIVVIVGIVAYALTNANTAKSIRAAV